MVLAKKKSSIHLYDLSVNLREAMFLMSFLTELEPSKEKEVMESLERLRLFREIAIKGLLLLFFPDYIPIF